MTYKVSYVAEYQNHIRYGEEEVSSPRLDKEAFRFVLAQLFEAAPGTLKRLVITKVRTS